MQRTWVRSLVWQDSKCQGAMKSLPHSYWAHTAIREAGALQLESRPHLPQLEKATRAATKTQHNQKRK